MLNLLLIIWHCNGMRVFLCYEKKKENGERKTMNYVRNCTEASSSFSSESEREEAGEPRQRRDRMCVELVALPQEISVAHTENSRGDCVRESLAVP